MSKDFTTTIKVISFIVGIGYCFLFLVPIIGNMVFTISLGTIDNLISSYHLVIYASLTTSALIVYLLYQVYKAVDGKKVISLLLILLVTIGLFQTLLIVASNKEREAYEERKRNSEIERKLFLKEHCEVFDSYSNGQPMYRCDDGTIR